FEQAFGNGVVSRQALDRLNSNIQQLEKDLAAADKRVGNCASRESYLRLEGTPRGRSDNKPVIETRGANEKRRGNEKVEDSRTEQSAAVAELKTAQAQKAEIEQNLKAARAQLASVQNQADRDTEDARLAGQALKDLPRGPKDPPPVSNHSDA